MMRLTKSGKTAARSRRAWHAPTITKLPIGTATKAPRAKGALPPAEPSPPAEPASKLGFTFEMGFPLSARTEG
jgi:hypothetical protein